MIVVYLHVGGLQGDASGRCSFVVGLQIFDEELFRCLFLMNSRQFCRSLWPKMSILLILLAKNTQRVLISVYSTINIVHRISSCEDMQANRSIILVEYVVRSRSR